MSNANNTLLAPLKSTGNFYVPIDIFDRPEITELIGHYGIAGVGYWLRIMAVLTAGCGRISKVATLGAGLTVGLPAEKWREILAVMIKVGVIRYDGDDVICDNVVADQVKANAKQSYWRDKKKAQRIGSTPKHTNGAIPASDDIPF